MAKKIITYIISFFLMVCIFVLFAIGVFSNTILNKQFTLSALDENDYYKKVYYNIKNDFEEYSISAGVDANELDGLFSIEQVTKDLNLVIDGIYENKQFKIDTSELVKKIDDLINSKLDENNRVPTAKEKKSIQTFETSLSNAYIDNIVFSEKNIERISGFIAKVNYFLPKVVYVTIAAIAILTVIIFAINKNVRNGIKGIATALIASGILGIAIQLLVENKVQNILIFTSAFSKTLTYILNSVISMFFTYGIVLCVIGLVLVIISCKGSNKRSEKHSV